MSTLSRIPFQEFDRNVTAADLDERFLLVGKLDGTLLAVYIKKGLQVFSVQLSGMEITAVCCEKHEEEESQVFYAGDRSGNTFLSQTRRESF